MKVLRNVVVAGIAACAMFGAAPAFADSGAPWTPEPDGSWRSGAISDGESSSKEVYVTGPCTVAFQWKVSSESGCDMLSCVVDADYESEWSVGWISGEADWANVAFELGDGEHTIRWTYSKDGSVSNGEDCGWVSGFAYGEACTIALDANGGYLSDGDEAVCVSGAPIGELPVPSKLDCEFDGWFTAVEGGEPAVGMTAADGLKFYAHWKPAEFDWYYDENGDGTLTLTGVETAARAFTIPSEIGGKKVTAIGSSAFAGMPLTGVVIPATVTEIGDYAFADCIRLTSVTMSEGLEAIDEDAFYDCYALTEVVIPATVTEIGTWAFAYCGNLANVTFNGDVSQIAIDPYAFVHTPWERLRPFEMMVEDGVVYGFHGTCPEVLTASDWPEGVKAIDLEALCDCYALTEVVIPATVTEIGDYAFGGCGNLEKVTFTGDVSQIAIDPFAFAYTPWERSRPFEMIVEDGVVRGFHGTCPEVLTASDWPEGVKAIDEDAFYNCYALTEVEIPATVTEIGDYAFADCGNLAKVTLNEGLDNVGYSAFCYTALTEVKIPATVTWIGDNAFAHCGSLQSAALPETLKDVLSSSIFAGSPVELTYYPVDMVTVVWDANGGLFWDGAEAHTNDSVVVGAHVEFGKPDGKYDVKYDGMYVAGWFTNPDGTGERVTEGTVALDGEDMVFYAFWQPLPFDATSEETPWSVVDEDGTCRSYRWGYSDNTESIMEKYVVGPADVSFKMRTQNDWDGELHFVVDGDYDSEGLVKLHYSSDWTNVTYRIEDDSEHALSWIFRRNTFGTWWDGCGEVADLVVRTTSILTLDAGEGTLADGEAKLEVRIGEAVGELPVPTREGYTFLGWVDANGEAVTADAVMGFDDMTLTATWELITYTLTLDPADGVFADGVAATLTLAPGAAYGELPVPTREGYTFLGWVDADGKAVTADTVMGAADAIITATWELITYTLTLDPADGVFADGVATTLTLAPGAAIGELPVPTRDGYVFLGWDAEIPAVMPAENLKFTAKWGAIAKTVEVVSGAGVAFEMPSNVVLVVGEPIGEENLANLEEAVLDAVPSRHGARLVGFYDGRNAVTAQTIVTEGMEIAAVWETFNPFSEDETSAVNGSAAQTFDGYVLDASGDVAGTIQVKLGKPNKKSRMASISATVQMLGQKKKLTFKGEEKGKVEVDDGNAISNVVLVCKGARNDIELEYISASGMFGWYGDYEIAAALNRSKKAVSDYSKWVGTYSVAFESDSTAAFAGGYSTLTVAVAAKGKVKVAGTMSDGTKVSASTQLIVGDGGSNACVNVVVPMYTGKKGGFGFALWLESDGSVVVESVSDWRCTSKPSFVAELSVASAGKVSMAKAGYEFVLVDDLPAQIAGAAVQKNAGEASLLPDGTVLTMTGKKLNAPKAGKVKYDKKRNAITTTGDNKNNAALKVAYTAKTGALKGSFSVYTLSGKKFKKVSAAVTGVMVDGVGYGTVSIKKVGAFRFELREIK